MNAERKWFGLLHRRRCWRPTRRGWLAVLVLVVVLGGAGIGGVHPFLAVSDPRPGGVLVVEGWGPDYLLRAAVKEFHRHPYSKLCVTGTPLGVGSLFYDFQTYADLGAAALVKLGMAPSQVETVPAPRVQRDRTYTSALALALWLRENGVAATNVNVMTLGPHARRTRLLFERALPRDCTVGVIAVPDEDYDAARWWASSEGTRNVIGEAIAYVYARFFFHP